MAVPFLDLTRKLNADGYRITYSEVLLASDYYKGCDSTPLMLAAKDKAYRLGVHRTIQAVMRTEGERRQRVLG